MRKLWRLASRSVYIPLLDTAQDTYRSLSVTGRSLFLFFATLLVLSSGALLFILNDSLIIAVPAHGGSLTEGVIGSPRFINPLLAISDADHDLTELVYSGLLRPTSEGTYIPDLAQEYEVSSDGKTYTFMLRKNATFHDGSPVTANDVVFTITKAQNAAVKSPVRANWEGVVIEKVDEFTVRFTLKNSYAPFVENLSLGILPSHLWQTVSDEEFPFSNLNTSPIGSGPFRINSISRTPSGIPASYELLPFAGYALGKPYLAQITLRFYQSENALATALKNGDVEAASGFSPAALVDLDNLHIEKSTLNRVFGVFFNQNQSIVLRDHDVRAALQAAIDREELISDVLGGYGEALESPVPPTMLQSALAAGTSSASALATSAEADPSITAQQMLIKKGWKLGDDGVLTKTVGTGSKAQTTTLSITLSTGNVPELRAAAEAVADSWTRMGADVEVQIFDQGDLSQNVIRPRKYDALLFGEVVGRELDLFAFWHSSQRNDPGLNVALYANPTADEALESLRATGTDEERKALYTTFEEELQKDIPAVFLYAPDFVYIVPNDIEGLDLGFIGRPSDRFLNANLWHRETEYVWPFFASR
ncbi:peptide ABC transporter substrate-binding protein [Acetobacteraceae bacterium]|nr:peptide ABC transporter substrate-binding protein [Candidatus Parcubacteria bacterium]